jgi:hypothetical protein
MVPRSESGNIIAIVGFLRSEKSEQRENKSDVEAKACSEAKAGG